MLLRRGGDVRAPLLSTILSASRRRNRATDRSIAVGVAGPELRVRLAWHVPVAPTTEHGWMVTGSVWSRESRSAQRSPVAGAGVPRVLTCCGEPVALVQFRMDQWSFRKLKAAFLSRTYGLWTTHTAHTIRPYARAAVNGCSRRRVRASMLADGCVCNCKAARVADSVFH